MDLTSLEVLNDGSVNVLALSWPDEGRTAPSTEALALPILKRQEGLLLCIPCGFLSLSLLDQGELAEAGSLIGPSHLTRVPFGLTDEQGLEVPLDVDGAVTFVDFSIEVLPQLRQVGEGFAAENLFPFLMDHPDALPLSEELLAAAKAWCSETALDRIAFYSAVEEPPELPPKGRPKKTPAAKKRVTTADLAAQVSQLSALLPQISEQLSSMRERQEALEKGQAVAPAPAQPPKAAHQMPFLPSRGPGLPLAKQASLLGPPRTRAPPNEAPEPPAGGGVLTTPREDLGPPLPATSQDAFQAALLQQSQALSSLVSHLVSQQDGGLVDLTGPSSSTSIGAKGAARREKLQAALASRTGGFFLAVIQSMSKRLHPASPVPTSLDDCLGQVSMCNYLERFGGFAGHRESGYLMWCLGHVMDCLINQDVAGAQEHLALTCVALDQSILDRGRWDFAWLLTLLEEPPSQLFHSRGVTANPRTRAFSPLSPVAWTTCALQFLKEVDLITTRRLESLGTPKHPPSAPVEEDAVDQPPKPPRKPRFPKKPKPDAK